TSFTAATPTGPASLYGVSEGDAWTTSLLTTPTPTRVTGIWERFTPQGGGTPQPGSALILDVGQDNEEIVEVQAIDTTVSPPTIRVSATKPHAVGFRITNARLGNPGPQSPPYGNFSYTQTPWSGTTVRYFVQLN